MVWVGEDQGAGQEGEGRGRKVKGRVQMQEAEERPRAVHKQDTSSRVSAGEGRGEGKEQRREGAVTPVGGWEAAEDTGPMSVRPPPPSPIRTPRSPRHTDPPPHLKRGVVVDERRCAQDCRQSNGYRHLGLLQLLPGLPRLHGVGEVWGSEGT